MSSGRPKIVVVVGLPGSGKSTWLAERGLPVLSSDHMRELLADDITHQGIHKQVFAALRYLLRQRIAIGQAVTYMDATHLTPKERRPYIRMAHKYDCPVEALLFTADAETCKARNRLRARVVPENVIDEMAAKLVKPTRAEGFSRVRTVP